MKYLRTHATAKSVLSIVVILAVFSAAVSIIGYRSFTKTLLNQYAEGAFLTAGTAAELINADRMDIYANSGGSTGEYKLVYDDLDRLCNSSGSTFIYVISGNWTAGRRSMNLPNRNLNS
ncbi:MAG: hypothetical protein K6E85_04060 [Lachnospiraceae bacterium]|nr:hypothetical protein [Lachnospiraceae bacterium]